VADCLTGFYNITEESLFVEIYFVCGISINSRKNTLEGEGRRRKCNYKFSTVATVTLTLFTK
jgi:hypothetical protein